MEAQRIFKSTYVSQLRREVKAGLILDYYKGNIFEVDPNKILYNPGISAPQNISLKMPDATSKYDFENAVILFEAFKGLSPLEASDIRLWSYLAHVDFYEYLSRRWPAIRNNTADNPSKYILDHWHISSPAHGNFLRHGLAGLWWATYLTYDDTRDDHYQLTRLIFKQLDMPTRTLGTYKLARHREAVIGILEFVQQNPELFKNKYQDKLRFITKYLNLIGGTKPLSYFHRDFFKNVLYSVKTKIETI